MNKWQWLGEWREELTHSFNSIWLGVANYIPKIFIAVVIFVIGTLIAGLIGQVVTHIVRMLKIDTLLRRVRVQEYVDRAGFKLDVAAFLGALVKWFIIIVFLVSALNTLQLTAVTVFLVQVLGFIPKVIIAVLILLAGLVIGEFLERVVVGGARAAELGKANILGIVTRWMVWVFAILASLYHLGIATLISEGIVQGFVIALSIAFGLAFGLGGQQAAADVIDRVRKGINEGR